MYRAPGSPPAPSTHSMGRPPGASRRHLGRTGLAIVPLVTFLAALGSLVPQPALAATAGSWYSLGTTPSTMTPAVFETSDHRAYVLWTKQLGANTFTYEVAEFSATGKPLSGPASIFGTHYWGSLSDQPTIVDKGSAPLVIFDGQRSANASDPYGKGCIVGALGPTLPWALQTWSLSANCVNPVGAASANDSGELSAAWPGGWTNGHGILYRIGHSPKIPAATPDQHIALSGPAVAAHVAMATDLGGNGHAYLAWVATGSSAGAQDGYYAKDLTSNGAVMRAPGSGSKSANISPFGVPAMANSLSRSGIFIAYCSNGPICNVELWRVPTAKAPAVPASSGAADIAISAGPDGRIWVAWYNETKNTVSVVRSNKSVTAFGAATTLATACAEHGLVGLTSGRWGRLGIALQCVNKQLKIEDFFTQAIVPLSISPAHVTVVNGSAQKVIFQVTDVGDPVPGATVKVGTFSAKTNASGTASVIFAKGNAPGQYSVVASGLNYVPATSTVVVTKPAK